MAYMVAGIPYSSELYHWGIKGQKWGLRRFQNEDGTLTEEGKARYRREINKMASKDAQRVSDAKAAYGTGAGTRRKLLNKEINQKLKNPDYRKAYEQASQHVNVPKSLRKAESLHRHAGTFERGQRLADSGKKVSSSILKAVGGAALTVGGAYAAGKLNVMNGGNKATSNVILAIGGISAATTLGKGVRDAYQVNYYERNKKF